MVSTAARGGAVIRNLSCLSDDSLHGLDMDNVAFPYYYLDSQWRRIKRVGRVDIPEGMVVYGVRHFFASNCLSNGIPVTDVAEWMGHNSIDVTFKTYRHLMPGSIGKAAKLLHTGLMV
ncbi:tyrosine-type recombinase/integrase [Streptomyces mirabilis]|uniref:tyrosine-type recombinase/integrase n=1 Tax=Streptomyces mirabilis TaxID=68239 RepID=UPI00368D22B7